MEAAWVMSPGAAALVMEKAAMTGAVVIEEVGAAQVDEPGKCMWDYLFREGCR